MLQGVKGELFREPRGDRWPWLWLLFGGSEIVFGLFFYVPREGQLSQLYFVTLGFMFIFWGASEVLPRDRMTLAAWLRVGVFVAITCNLVVLILDLLSRAS